MVDLTSKRLLCKSCNPYPLRKTHLEVPELMICYAPDLLHFLAGVF